MSEQKRAEEELRLSAEIIENMAEGVCLLRASDGVLVFTNPGFDQIFGYETGELSGQHTAILNAPGDDTPKETAEKILRDLEETGSWSGEVQNIRKNGTPFWTHSSVSTFEHPQHGTTKVMGMPVKLAETPGQLRMPAPELGQHTEEILLDVLGYDWDRVTELRKREVI